MSVFSLFALSPLGAFVVLAIAAYLEVQGDACFQLSLYHSSGLRRVGWEQTQSWDRCGNLAVGWRNIPITLNPLLRWGQ